MNDLSFITNFLKQAPKSVRGVNAAMVLEYYDDLLEMVESCFKFKNLPETIPEFNFYRVFDEGVIGFFKTVYGSYLLPATYSGQDVNYFPTHLTYANPVIGSGSYRIGTECEPFYINYDPRSFTFTDLRGVLVRFAVKLAMADASVDMSLMNSRIAQVFKATNQTELKSLQRMYDQITQGNPAVFLKKGINDDGDWVLFANVKNSYIANDILMTKRTIMDEFLTYIGINNANTDKRERLNAEEVHANDGERLSHIYVWLDHMQTCLKKANKLLGTNMSVELTEVVKEKEVDYEPVEPDGSIS